MSTLVVWTNDGLMGRIEQNRGKLRFDYDETFRHAEHAFPLSLSMPLAAASHAHARINAFLWGLLPDNQQILAGWAKAFHVSSSNAFALLGHVGEDCAGAISLLLPERVTVLRESSSATVMWLSERDIEQRLHELREDHSAWRRLSDTGQFSLAGAQPKTALLWNGKRFGIPSGRIPTTHILKPPIAGLDGHVYNEHFCLALARSLGMPTATSAVQRFGDELAIVVERYDRQRIPSSRALKIQRIHQEDFCQALGRSPALKYQNQGGPSPEEIVACLRDNSSAPEADVNRFVDALILNWLIVGTDAHAKNYSLLHAPAARARLAPLYDVASVLPYKFDQRRQKLAMKIGDSYRVHDIGKRHFRKLASALGLDPEQVLARAIELATDIGPGAERVRDQLRRDGAEHPVVERLAAAIPQRAKQCLKQLD